MKQLSSLLLLTAFYCAAPGTANAQTAPDAAAGLPVESAAWNSTDDDYYYLPADGVYYNISHQVYVFPENSVWLYAPTLPARYKGATWQGSQYVRLRERSPFVHHEIYAARYPTTYRHGVNGEDGVIRRKTTITHYHRGSHR